MEQTGFTTLHLPNGHQLTLRIVYCHVRKRYLRYRRIFVLISSHSICWQDLTPPSSQLWTHLSVTPAPLARLHCPFTQSLRRCILRELAPLAPHIFSRAKSFAPAEISVARGFRLALRGGKGLAKRLTLRCCRAESNLPLFLLLLFVRIKKKALFAYYCA